jgi:hypothetical protein
VPRNSQSKDPLDACPAGVSSVFHAAAGDRLQPPILRQVVSGHGRWSSSWYRVILGVVPNRERRWSSRSATPMRQRMANDATDTATSTRRLCARRACWRIWLPARSGPCPLERRQFRGSCLLRLQRSNSRAYELPVKLEPSIPRWVSLVNIRPFRQLSSNVDRLKLSIARLDVAASDGFRVAVR